VGFVSGVREGIDTSPQRKRTSGRPHSGKPTYHYRCAKYGLQFQTLVWLWHVRPGINAITLATFEDINEPKLHGGV